MSIVNFHDPISQDGRELDLSKIMRLRRLFEIDSCLSAMETENDQGCDKGLRSKETQNRQILV